MFNTKIDYHCQICNQDKFYFIPLDVKINSNDKLPSNHIFRIQCKSCGQDYILNINIKLAD